MDLLEALKVITSYGLTVNKTRGTVADVIRNAKSPRTTGRRKHNRGSPIRITDTMMVEARRLRNDGKKWGAIARAVGAGSPSGLSNACKRAWEANEAA